MQFRFYINNTLVTEPRGTDDLTTSITRYRDIHGLLVKQDVSVTFTDDGYDLLRKVYDNNGWSSFADIIIQYTNNKEDQWRNHYTGTLYIRDIEWDLKRKYAKVPIVDNSWYSRLNNNKSIKVKAGNTVPKSGDTDIVITLPTCYSAFWYDQTNLSTVLDDASNESYCPYFRLKDYLSYTIKYLTDDSLLFESSLLNAGGEFEHLKITSGWAFRSSMISTYNQGSGTNYKNQVYGSFIDLFEGITLDEMLKNFYKIANISFIIDYSTSKPTFRIERESYFEDNEKILVLENVNDIKERIDTSIMYSSVKFGSGKVAPRSAGWTALPEGLKLVMFNQEEYVISYAANLDNTLDLQLTYITSANVIQDIFANRYTNGDDYYDKDIIFWNFEDDGIVRDSAIGLSNWIDFTQPPSCYNFKLTNAEIATRFFGGIPSSIISQLPTTLDERFLAYSLGDHVQTWSISDFIQPIIFDEDTLYPGFDANGNWDTALYQYKAANTGVYTFNAVLNGVASPTFLISSSPVWVGLNFTLSARRYDVANNYIAEYIIGNYVFSAIASEKIFNIFGVRSIQMSSGDYLEFRLSITYSVDGVDLIYSIKQNSFIECTSSPEYNYSFGSYNQDDYSPVRFELNHAISDEQFRKVLNNPKGEIDFSLSGGEQLTGRLESLKMNHRTGKAQFILNSKKKRLR